MRHPHYSLALISLLLVAQAPTSEPSCLQANETFAVQQARIDPRGITGTLILTGDTPPDQAFDRFVDFAKQAGERLVVLQFGSGETVKRSVLGFVTAWQSSESTRLEVVRITDEVSCRHAAKVIAEATAVWLAGNNDATEMDMDAELCAAITNVLQRDGIVGCSGRLTASFGNFVVSPDDPAVSVCESHTTLKLLPDSIIYAPSSEASDEFVRCTTNRHPHLVGYVIEPDSALIVKGRRLRAVGPGRVRVYLAQADGRASDPVTLSKNHIGDLTAFRRAARDRCADPFPPQHPDAPVVEHGTLIAIGGDGMPSGLVDRFVELAGGKDASIVVLPTAMPDPVRRRNGMARSFRDAGAGHVVVLPDRTLSRVESNEYLDAFRAATGIWFGGGRQWRFVDAYMDTKAQALMHDLLKRGGVIMGSSAGASIQAEYLVRGNPLGNTDVMADGYERGLGFLSGTAIDQHFTSRDRFSDLTAVVARYPQILGIGIDGGTAIVVQGNSAEVVGKGGVHFFDARRSREPGDADYETVESGSSYNLETRRAD